jgi:hypothetical protein
MLFRPDFPMLSADKFCHALGALRRESPNEPRNDVFSVEKTPNTGLPFIPGRLE